MEIIANELWMTGVDLLSSSGLGFGLSYYRFKRNMYDNISNIHAATAKEHGVMIFETSVLRSCTVHITC